ncbi:MAG: hypothetical protein Q9210_006035 [Variospora velana]
MASTDTAPQPVAQQTNVRANLRGNNRRPYRGAPARRFQSHNHGPRPPPIPGEPPNNPVASSRDLSLALRPSSVAASSQPSSAAHPSAENPATEAPGDNNSRGGPNRFRRGMRGERRGGGVRGRDTHASNSSNANVRQLTGNVTGSTSVTRLPTGRQFGGQLTTPLDPTDPSSNSTHTMSADAPEFRPGQPHQPGPKGSHNVRKAPAAQHTHSQRHRRDSGLKSNAPDIATRTHEDIANSLYECPICTSEVGRNSKMWSCKTCWTVFHLACIKKWAANDGSTLSQQRDQDRQLPAPRQWRCPGCNLPKDDVPIHYTCWCEKEFDPSFISGIPPHSCGQSCGKSRILPKKCPHPCEMLCHAGPCPPCTHMGPTESCYCGKNMTSKRCVDTDYGAGWSCGQICADLMPCGAHTCQKPCHEGLCGGCEVLIESRCYCGKVDKPIPCYEHGDEKPSKKASKTDDGSGTVEEWIGSFRCGEVCQREYDCGKHLCEQSCHSQDNELAPCPRSPGLVRRCPCGKTALEEISSIQRQSCTDPIPNCRKQCSKTLPCGHPCQRVCHSDNCLPCLLTIPISCRCGRVQASTICHQGHEQQPQCRRHCKATLNCGRHECGERCCPSERKASERQAIKRKLRPLGAPRALDNEIEAEHICTRSCARPLKCGYHTCPELCHKGACGGCREAIFEELSCHCGRTVLQPPLPCGTKPPPCRFDCERPKLCGHPKTSHNCHGDETSCPKCPYLIEKPCMCGKKLLKNQPCWLVDARCGEICGKKLKCGSHFCRRPCHRSGECEDAGKTCLQACGKLKRACGHPCEETCHAPSACREDKPCQNKMLITCECQHLKQEMKCNASKSSEGNSKKSLGCDDECARLERNRKLALALKIDPEASKDDHIPYSTDTLKMFRENVKWSQEQEREFRVFATNDAEKRLRFKAMPSHQRTFLHSLAQDFGFDSESMDPEPHRHVAVFKTPRFVSPPTKTIKECVRIQSNAEAAAASVLEEQRRLRSNNEAYNGFLLGHPRFGLTFDVLRSELTPQFNATPGLAFDISFLPTEEIVIKAKAASLWTNIQPSAIEAVLKAMKGPVAAIVSTKRLAETCQLCSLDASLNILRRALEDEGASDGWNRVASKAVGPRYALPQRGVGEKSVYTVLGSKIKDAKRKKEELEKAMAEEVPVEDWAEEVRREEEMGVADKEAGTG